MGRCKNCGHETEGSFCSDICTEDYTETAKEVKEEMTCGSCGEKIPCICEETELQQETEQYEATLENYRENPDFADKHKD